MFNFLDNSSIKSCDIAGKLLLDKTRKCIVRYNVRNITFEKEDLCEVYLIVIFNI